MLNDHTFYLKYTCDRVKFLGCFFLKKTVRRKRRNFCTQFFYYLKNFDCELLYCCLILIFHAFILANPRPLFSFHCFPSFPLFPIQIVARGG